MTIHPHLNGVGDLVAFTILLYDHILTFSDEVLLFWTQSRRSLIFALFIANRYLALGVHVAGVIQVFLPALDPACHSLMMIAEFGVIFTQLTSGIIMALRVYAFYGRSKPVLIFLSTIVLILVGFGCWAVSAGPDWLISFSGLEEDGGCAIPISWTRAQHMAIAWGSQLGYDAIIFVMTVYRSFQVGKLSNNRTIIDIMLRDGSVYFAAISAVNVANIVIRLQPSSTLKSSSGVITNSVCVIMVSRLMLNLRKPSEATVSTSIPLRSINSSALVTTYVTMDNWSEEFG